MPDKETRPLQSGMPAHLLPIYNHAAPIVMDAVAEIYEAVLASVGRPEELENDALSLQAEVIGNAIIAFSWRLAQVKGASLEQAFGVALEQVAERSAKVMFAFLAQAGGAGETTQ